MNAGSLLALESLSVGFSVGGREIPVLEDIDLLLAAGEVLALVGESGGGKTMLGRAIMGLLPPDAWWRGRIIWRGETLHRDGHGDSGILGRDIAMIFQDAGAALNPVITIGNLLTETIGHLQPGLDSARSKVRALQFLSDAGLSDVDGIFSRYAHQLSGGQKQRVMLALALAGDPSLLIADEPTTALDSQIRLGVLKQIGELTRDRGAATIFITHDLSLASAIADRIAVLHRGRLVECAATSAVLRRPTADHTRELIRALPCNTPERSFAETTSEGPALSLDGISVDYTRRVGPLGLGTHRVTPLRSVDLELMRGDALALVGESGCGKTTLARVASLLLPPARGRVRIDGQELRTSSPGKLRQRVQMIFQDSQASLNPRLTCGRTLEESLQASGKPASLNPADAVAKLLETVDLPVDVAHRYPHQLSGGQRQRVALARAVSVDPLLLIADEPTSSLDLTVQASVMNLLETLRIERSLALLLITHDLQLALKNCRRVAVMLKGEIVEVFAADQTPQHPYTLQLMSAMNGDVSGPVRDPIG
jgi:ABC-type glutathione transport system ATPase component